MLRPIIVSAPLLLAGCAADTGGQAPRELGSLARNAAVAIDAGGEREPATLDDVRAQVPFEVLGPTFLPHGMTLQDVHAILPVGALAGDGPHEATMVRMWFRSDDRSAAAVLDQALELEASEAAQALTGEGRPVDLAGAEGRLYRDVYRQCDERGRDCTVLRLVWEACDRSFMLEAVTEPDRPMSREDLERIGGSIVRRCR